LFGRLFVVGCIFVNANVCELQWEWRLASWSTLAASTFQSTVNAKQLASGWPPTVASPLRRVAVCSN